MTSIVPPKSFHRHIYDLKTIVVLSDTTACMRGYRQSLMFLRVTAFTISKKTIYQMIYCCSHSFDSLIWWENLIVIAHNRWIISLIFVFFFFSLFIFPLSLVKKEIFADIKVESIQLRFSNDAHNQAAWSSKLFHWFRFHFYCYFNLLFLWFFVDW